MVVALVVELVVHEFQPAEVVVALVVEAVVVALVVEAVVVALVVEAVVVHEFQPSEATGPAAARPARAATATNDFILIDGVGFWVFVFALNCD